MRNAPYARSRNGSRPLTRSAPAETTSSTSTTWLEKKEKTARHEESPSDPVASENSAAKPPRRIAFQKRTRPAKRYALLAPGIPEGRLVPAEGLARLRRSTIPFGGSR
jgi:hypothetical protein